MKYFLTKRFFVFLIFLFKTSTSFCITFNPERFIWGETEIISTNGEKINKVDFLKGSPLLHYMNKSANEDNIEEIFTWCNENLKSQLSNKVIDCSMEVDNKNRKFQFIIGIADLPIKQSVSLNKDSSILIEPKLIQAQTRFSEFLQSFWGTTRDLNTEIRQRNNNQYFTGYTDINLDKKATELNLIVSPYKKHIFDILMTSDDEEGIRIAIGLLKHVGLTKEDIALLVDSLPNSTPDIAEGIFSTVVDFSFLVDKEIEEKLIKHSLYFISSINSDLRANSLETLKLLLERNSEYKKHIDMQTKKYINYLVTNSILEKVQTPAQRISKLMEYSA